MKRLWWLVFSLWLAFTPVAFAQSQPDQEIALQVSPAILEQVVEPGTQTEATILVTNKANIPLPIKATVRGFTPLEEISIEDRAIFDASAWFKIAEPDFILQPGQRRDIKLTIKPPSNAEPGGHYATVFFQTLIPESALSQSTAHVANRVGVLAFLLVKGDITERASLAGPPATPFMRQFGPVNLTTTVVNRGNVHLLPRGQVIIFDWRGREVARLPIPQSTVLPKSRKDFKVTWQESKPIGRFTAKTEITYGSANSKLESEQTEFWILPWLPFTFSLIVGILIVFFIFKTIKRWPRAIKALEEPDESEADHRGSKDSEESE